MTFEELKQANKDREGYKGFKHYFRIKNVYYYDNGDVCLREGNGYGDCIGFGNPNKQQKLINLIDTMRG